MAHYCSRECQKEHWKSGDHREHCPRLRAVSMSALFRFFSTSHLIVLTLYYPGVSPYQPLNSIDLSALYLIFFLRQDWIQQHWDFCKGDGYNQLSLDLIDLVTGHTHTSKLPTYYRFKRHDVSHWYAQVARRAPKGDAPYIFVGANGWPVEITTLEEVRAMRIQVQHFGDNKYES